MIYLDNAATSFPKPQSVREAAREAIETPLGNPGRSGHPLSLKSADIVYGAREAIARLVGSKPENIILTSGATAACNMAILGTVAALRKRIPRPLVVTSVFEHNSVLRPLYSLENAGLCTLKILSPDQSGSFPLRELLSPPPQLLILTCRSNVTGREFPLRELSCAVKRYGATVISDAAQGLGDGDFTFSSTGADMLCGAGHKGLFGIMGAGFLAVSENSAVLPEAIFSGGSGTDSFHPFMPEFLPERLEAGTLPVPAIAAMAKGAEFVLREGKEIHRIKRQNKNHLIRGILSLKNYIVYEPEFDSGPLLINHRTLSPEEIATRLSQHGIYVRQGFHCAPLAHRFLGTEKRGAVRLSPGPFNTLREMDQVTRILSEI